MASALLSARMCADVPSPDLSGTLDPYRDDSHELTPTFLRSRKASAALVAGGVAVAGLAAAALALTIRSRNLRAEAMRGKVVLITGSSRGLGLALAEEFGRLGARIVLTARNHDDLERAKELLLLIDAVKDPADILVVPADLRQHPEAEYLAHRVIERWGQVDVLVNNAGIITVAPVENHRVQDFHDVMDSNFFTGLHCTMAVLPHMLRRRQGTIVNITSIGGKVSVPHLLPYSASKFAAVGFSQGLHAELSGKGVHVLTVCPGLMRTGSHLNAYFAGDAEREYRWFAFGATSPGVAASARHAAQRILRAVLDRESEVFITPQAALAGRAAQVLPEVTSLVMGLMNRVLPNPAEDVVEPRRGAEVRDREPFTASTLGWDAARRYNELGLQEG